MGKLKKAVSLAVLLLFSFTVFGCGSKTVAVVNGEKITQEQLDKEMANKKKALEQQGASFNSEQGKQMLKSLEQQTVEELIQQTLLMQAVKKEDLMPTKSEINKQIDDLKKKFGGEDKFNQLLKQYNYTMDDITDKVKTDLAYSKLFDKVTKGIKVTEQDAEKYYNENKSQFVNPEKYKARMIVISFGAAESGSTTGRSKGEAEKLSKNIIAQLSKGEDFAKLAKSNNDEETLKAEGGLVKDQQGNTFFAKGSLSPSELEEALAGLKVGEYTKTPVLANNAYYILKLEDKTKEKQLSFAEARAEIMKQLPNMRKQEKFNEYFTKLQKEAKIENKMAKDANQDTQQSTQVPASDGQQQLPAAHPKV